MEESEDLQMEESEDLQMNVGGVEAEVTKSRDQQ